MEYEDLELQIGPQTQAGFLVRVLRSPAGQGEGYVELPTAAAGLAPFGGAARGLRPPEGEERAATKTPAEMGGRLFDALFSGQVGSLFYQSLSRVGEGRGLRLRLRINPRDPALTALRSVAWELLFREDTEDFLGLSRRTPIVRALDIPRPLPPRPVVPPLRILLVPFQAPDQDRLDLEGEVKALERILDPKAEIEVLTLENPDTHSLRNVLSSHPVHVLHLLGHGTFDPRSGDGALLFRGPQGTTLPITGRHLATVIKDFESLRLVVLNACETARTSAGDNRNAFAGVGTALVLGGIPAVVAMQSPIPDPEAVAFSTAFYERLAVGMPVDEAVTEGRQAIHSRNPESTAWAVPVLFLRAPSGNLFAYARPSEGERDPHPLSTWQRWRKRLASILVAVALLAWGERLWWYWEDFFPPPPVLRPAPVPPPDDTQDSPAEPDTLAVDGGEVFTVGSGSSSLRIELTGDRRYRSAVAAALRQAAAAYVGAQPPQGGASLAIQSIHLDLAVPSTTEFEDGGHTWHSCRLTALCRAVRRTGEGVSLGRVEATRSHALNAAACDAAANTLAETLLRRLTQL